MRGYLIFTCVRDEHTASVIVDASEKRSVPPTHSQSIVNPREKLDFIARCRAWLRIVQGRQYCHIYRQGKRAFLR